MRTVIIYESMYGNTRAVAEAVAAGMRDGTDDVTVTSVARFRPAMLDDVGLVVVGGPTHMHGMSKSRTRYSAVQAARKEASRLVLDPDAEGPGLRDWFGTLGQRTANAAAFDTRMRGKPWLTGRASKRIAALLRRHGLRLVTQPQSFLVSNQSKLLDGELDRATDWGRQLAGASMGRITA